MAQVNLQKIVSVKGQAGLFHLVSYNPKGYFLQPFEGGATRFFSNEKGKVLAIGNVDFKLKEGSINALGILNKMMGTPLPTLESDEDAITAFFNKVIPDLDPNIPFSHKEKFLKWARSLLSQISVAQIVNEEDDGLTIT